MLVQRRAQFGAQHFASTQRDMVAAVLVAGEFKEQLVHMIVPLVGIYTFVKISVLPGCGRGQMMEGQFKPCTVKFTIVAQFLNEQWIIDVR